MARGRFAEKGTGITVPVYPQDPGVLDPVGVKIDASNLQPGPIGPRVAVYEYNRDVDQVFAQARQTERGMFPRYGKNDLRAHQLNVYAIADLAIELVEQELGRDLSWGFSASRLIVLPHAGQMDNAFYDEETHSLQFYSFMPTDGGPLYHTCLSHDIVAHEVGHALLDAIRDRYTESVHPQTSALHEGIGDLTALFASLSYPSVREVVLTKDMDGDNLVSRIAEDFDGTEIRNLFGGPDRKNRITKEPHHLSLWLTRAIYDSLGAFYVRGLRAGDDEDRALRVGRRALQRMVVRALDYLPPAEATFRDYALAIIASDAQSNPGDTRGYRKALIGELKRHKVVDRQDLGVAGRGAGELWSPLPASWPGLSKQDAYRFLDANRKRLALNPYGQYRDFVVSDLQLTTRPPFHRIVEQVVIVYEYPVEVEIEYDGEKFWHSIWGGGTVVFDWKGRCVHHAEKPVTRETVRDFKEFMTSDDNFELVGRVEATQDDAIRQAYSTRPWSLHVSKGESVLRTNPAARCHCGPTVGKG